MIPVTATWANVETGCFLKDRSGETWKVERRYRGGLVSLANRAGESRTMQAKPDATPITMLVPTEDEAIANVSAILGGVIIERT